MALCAAKECKPHLRAAEMLALMLPEGIPFLIALRLAFFCHTVQLV